MPDSIETPSPQPQPTFAQLLHQMRLRAGLTSRQLADRVSYDEAQISRLENNRRPPDPGIIQKHFLSALGLSTDSEEADLLICLAREARHRSLRETPHTSKPNQNTPRKKKSVTVPADATSSPIGLQPLRSPLTSFVGRIELLSDLQKILSCHRLITLTGVGGGGKTTLALEIARFHLAQPVYWVELAGVSDPTEVARTIALQIGGIETQTQSPLTAICRVVANRACWLLLDNCEHLLAAVAEIAQSLLQACPHLCILATSRELLKIKGEKVVEVPPMVLPVLQPLPDLTALAQNEAVQLFVERAQNNWSEFVLNVENSYAVAELCHRLDGMPLAIELAAGWVKSLQVEEIVAALSRRFDLLTNGNRTPQRHQSLRNLIDWSYGLLQPDERALLRKLSVFRAGFSLDAAEAVGQGWTPLAPLAVLHQVHHLVEKSLLKERREQGYRARYQLLETIRDYGIEKLVEAGEINRSKHLHFTYYLHLAEEAEPKLKGEAQAVWFQRMDLEQDNFRAALTYASDHSPAAGLQLLLALQHFWNVRGCWCEWEEWLEKLMATAGMPPATSVGTRALSLLALKTTNQREADKLFAESAVRCQVSGDKQDLAHYHLCRASRVWWDNSIQAKAHFEQSLLIYREIGDQWHTAFVLRALGELVQVRLEALSKARSLLTLSLELYREQTDDWGVAEALAYLANTALAQGDLAGVQTYAQEALQLSKRLDFKEGIFWASLALGVNAWGYGRYVQAATLFQDASSVAQATGDHVYTAVADYWLATSIRYQGEYAQAAISYQNMLRASRAKQYWWGVGFSLYGLGEIARLKGDIKQSIKYLIEALVALDRITYRRGIIRILDSLALLAFPNIEAVYFFSMAAALRSTSETALYAVEEDEINLAMTALQTLLGAETFAEAWAAGQTMAKADTTEYALQWATNHCTLPSSSVSRLLN